MVFLSRHGELAWKKNQAGQSFVEFLILVPLFFVITGGLVLLFQVQLRAYTDVVARESLMLSAASFDQQERRLADWSTSHEKTEDFLNKVAEFSFNPSRGFPHSLQMKNSVFIEKKRIVREQNPFFSSSACSGRAAYDLKAQPHGRFELQTCADDSGYETAPVLFLEDATKNLKNMQSVLDGESVFLPKDDFSWLKRPFEAGRGVASFALSRSGVDFMKNEASLFVPDFAAFNSRCYMEPFSPECSLPPPVGKFERAAIDASKAQVALCIGELTVNCGGTPQCVVLKMLELAASLAGGKRSASCPMLNKTLELQHNAAVLTVTGHALTVSAKEVKKRAELLRR